jgi:hypothetical protein
VHHPLSLIFDLPPWLLRLIGFNEFVASPCFFLTGAREFSPSIIEAYQDSSTDSACHRLTLPLSSVILPWNLTLGLSFCSVSFFFSLVSLCLCPSGSFRDLSHCLSVSQFFPHSHRVPRDWASCLSKSNAPVLIFLSFFLCDLWSRGIQAWLGGTVPMLWLVSLLAVQLVWPGLSFSMDTYLHPPISPPFSLSSSVSSDGYGVFLPLCEAFCFRESPSFFVAVQSAMAWPARAVQMTF